MEHEFILANGVRFDQMVSINTTVEDPRKRFGIEQDHIDEFIEEILKVEVEGRRFRTKYQILMKTGSPQAENFLWTILGNKVSLVKSNNINYLIRKITNRMLLFRLFRKPRRLDNVFIISNLQHFIGRSSQNWRPKKEFLHTL